MHFKLIHPIPNQMKLFKTKANHTEKLGSDLMQVGSNWTNFNDRYSHENQSEFKWIEFNRSNQIQPGSENWSNTFQFQFYSLKAGYITWFLSNCFISGVFDLTVSFEHLFFIGSQLVALSSCGKIGVWHSVTQHWQASTLFLLNVFNHLPLSSNPPEYPKSSVMCIVFGNFNRRYC